ncbi:unnamed protein product [Caenorhabditis auriculariae]|uniref:Uncharacterized protein n=1 Tax=Caenorhabditis auriculariae TaxID=2777116 RepID=A0A8S1GLV4_9PELO|nr:unnamed protein product [Caenorhabditis auriculariae]
MINIFNSPIDPVSLDEFAEGNDRDEQPLFDAKRRKPLITYHTDGRKVVDGVVENENGSNALWTTTITRGVANEWKENATGGRLHRAKRYIWQVSYDARVLATRTTRQHATAILGGINLVLFLVFLYVFRLFPFSRTSSTSPAAQY